jgi:serine/threonine protein kinase
MIETGTTLQQRYKIDKQIGQGGMGAVYVATDSRFGSTVAIKETLCMDDNFRKAIEREARLLNSLKHAALPRVSDHFEENDGMFLVMEYIPGDDVAAMLENTSIKFTVEQVMKWADQLLDALDYLHNQELPVIHRDIKPQNLKLNSRGEMILLDFGLAKGNPTDAGHHTAAKSIFGYSRNYASLEQIQGTGTDPRSDLYSLAATLYHLLTRVPPEDALTRAMSVLSQKPDPLVPASALNPEVPRGVAGVLQKAMDLNASERPATAEEMRQMLRESERYAYLAESATFSTNVTDPRVFAQPTRLMPEGTNANLSSSNAQTEVLPVNISEMTSVRSAVPAPGDTSIAGSTTAAPSRGRGFGVAAGAAMVLLLGVAALAGVYFVRPSVLGFANEPQKPSEAPVTTTSSSSTADNALAPPASTAANAVPGSELGSTAEANTARDVTDNNRTEADKNSAAAKQETKATTSAKPTTDKDQGEVTEITVDDPDIPRGGVVLTERDENGQVRTIRVNPVKPPPGFEPKGPDGRPLPPFPNVDMSKLTPMQRQKLMRVLRNNPQLRPHMTPKPQPTPPQTPKN